MAVEHKPVAELVITRKNCIAPRNGYHVHPEETARSTSGRCESMNVIDKRHRVHRTERMVQQCCWTSHSSVLTVSFADSCIVNFPMEITMCLCAYMFHLIEDKKVDVYMFQPRQKLCNTRAMCAQYARTLRALTSPKHIFISAWVCVSWWKCEQEQCRMQAPMQHCYHVHCGCTTVTPSACM